MPGVVASWCKAASVSYVAPPFDCHQVGGQECNEFLASAIDGEHLCLSERECPARFHHLAASKDEIASSGCNEIDLEFSRQHTSVGWHWAESGVTRCRVSYGADRACMNETMLLGKGRSGADCDLNKAWGDVDE
jgi:hypothetical protein